MRKRVSRFASAALLCAVAVAGLSAQQPIRVAVTGESNLRTNVVVSLKDAAHEAGITIDVVPKSEAHDYLFAAVRLNRIPSYAILSGKNSCCNRCL